MKDRNKFVHSFWREELSGEKSPDGWNHAALDFTSALLADALKWQKVFKGILGVMVLAISSKATQNEALQEVLEKTNPFLGDYLNAIK